MKLVYDLLYGNDVLATMEFCEKTCGLEIGRFVPAVRRQPKEGLRFLFDVENYFITL